MGLGCYYYYTDVFQNVCSILKYVWNFRYYLFEKKHDLLFLIEISVFHFLKLLEVSLSFD